MPQDEVEEAELPFENVGQKLGRLRQAAGLSRADLAARTRIPERHLAAIEAGDFAALPARAYAVGFTRSYAKALGLDDQLIAAEVRAELAGQDPALGSRMQPAFEPGDPARVPGSRFAWLAAFGALGVIVACFVLWRGYFAPGGELPSILPAERPVAATPAPVAVPAPAAVPTGGPVIFTAEQSGVWVKFYDGAGTQLLQKELALGESYAIPETAAGVLLATARPDALAITIGGQPVPKLAERQTVMKDVPVTAAALLARGNPTPAVAVPASPPASQPARRPVRAPVQGVRVTAPQSAPSPAPTTKPADAAPAPAAT
jgi:transcriptional regulator with XRE-family HTH domain